MDAYNNYVMQHELAVAQQQSETWKKAMEDTAEAFMIAAKLSSGAQITSNEAQNSLKLILNYTQCLYVHRHYLISLIKQ